jgi:hypothetical protein
MVREKAFSGFPWGMLALCSAFLFATTVALKFKMLDSTLGDTDDAMRLVQLREFLQHQNWFDLHTQRVGGSEGYTSHWSRIPDAIMAVIFLAFQQFTSGDVAEKMTRAFYPGLWIMPAFTALTLFAYKQVPSRHVALVMLLLFATNPASLIQFSAGRIDHHNAQISFSILAVVFAALQRVDWRFACASGASIGLMFTIGLEAIPFAVVAAFAVAANYAVFEDGRKAAQGFAATLALVTLLGYGLSFAPANYFNTACDALGVNLLVGIVGGCCVLFLWSRLSKLNTSFARRIGGLVLSGAIALGLYVGSDTACLGGPFGHVDPAIKPIWLDKVREMQPVFGWQSFAENMMALPFVYILVLTFPAIVLLLRAPDYRTNFTFLVMLFCFVVSLFVGFMSIRMSLYTVWFATPLVCLAIIHLMNTLSGKKLFGALAFIIAFSPIAMLFWVEALANHFVVEAKANNSASTTCMDPKKFAEIKTLPKGLVLAELDLGPYVLAHTDHSVVAAPYHRMDQSILQVVTFYTTESIEEARQIVKKTGSQYVMFCSSEIDAGSLSGGKTIKKLLQAGVVPDWLERVEMPVKNPMAVYRVKEQGLALP